MQSEPDTRARIEFAQKYCHRYPENDFYSYMLVVAIRDHLIKVAEDTDKYMPQMLRSAQKLLETRY